MLAIFGCGDKSDLQRAEELKEEEKEESNEDKRNREQNEELNALKKKNEEEGNAGDVAAGQRGLLMFPPSLSFGAQPQPATTEVTAGQGGLLVFPSSLGGALSFGAQPQPVTYTTPIEREILVPVGFTNMATIGKASAENSPLIPLSDEYQVLLLNEQKKVTMLTDEKNYLESALKLSQGEADMARKLLTARQARIDDLERDYKLAQLELQARPSVPSITYTPPPPPDNTKEVADLRRQVEELQRLKKSLDDQAVIDHATIAKLRTAVNDQLSKQKAGTDSDAQHLRDIAAVNDMLKSLAYDQTFQEDLKRRLVQVALECWRGEHKNVSEEDKNAARYDEGVQRIYPKLKDFEKYCDGALIPFPIDHIVAHRSELSPEAIAYAFGPDFVSRTTGNVRR